VLNTNPVVLDSAGRATIFGLGQYRQVLTDQFGVQIWDKQVEAAITEGDLDVAITTLYDLPIYIEGKPSAGEVFPIFNAPRDLTLPVGLTGSVFSVATLPTAAMVCTFYKNGVSIGSVSFATNGVPTVTFVSEVSFGSGDQFRIQYQNPADATGGDIGMTFVFTVI
jgi:hypothetical protein